MENEFRLRLAVFEPLTAKEERFRLESLLFDDLI